MLQAVKSALSSAQNKYLHFMSLSIYFVHFCIPLFRSTTYGRPCIQKIQTIYHLCTCSLGLFKINLYSMTTMIANQVSLSVIAALLIDCGIKSNSIFPFFRAWSAVFLLRQSVVTAVSIYRRQPSPLLYGIEIWPARNSRLTQREANHYIARCASVLAWCCLVGRLTDQLVIDLFCTASAICCMLSIGFICIMANYFEIS